MSVSQSDVIKVTCKMRTGTNILVENVYFIQKTDEGDVTDEDFVSEVSTYLSGLYNTYKTYISNSISTVEILFYHITEDRPMPSGVWTGFVTGSASGDNSPAGIAPLLTLRTATKRAVGRKFLPFTTETNIVGDNITSSAMLTAMGVLAAALTGEKTFGTSVFQGWFGTWSKKYTRFAPYVSFVANAVLAYQRRRKPGVGE